MDKAFLYQLADKAKTKASEYTMALETYQDELEKSGRDATQADADTIQRLREKLLEKLNVHAKIYRQIYSIENN